MSKSLEDIIFDLIELFRPHIEGIDTVLDVGTGTFKKVGLKVYDKIEIPYYGTREIRKYFFKLK